MGIAKSKIFQKIGKFAKMLKFSKKIADPQIVSPGGYHILTRKKDPNMTKKRLFQQ